MSTVPDKLYYRIGEVETITEIPAYVLRYWESEFKLLRPKKNPAGLVRHRGAVRPALDGTDLVDFGDVIGQGAVGRRSDPADRSGGRARAPSPGNAPC